MGSSHAELKESIVAVHRLYMKNQQTTLRECLGCSQLFHSTGVDHRICNLCKGTTDFQNSYVGRRAGDRGLRSRHRGQR